MRKLMLLAGMVFVLTGCGNAVQTSSETGAAEVQTEAVGAEAESADTAETEESTSETGSADEQETVEAVPTEAATVAEAAELDTVEAGATDVEEPTAESETAESQKEVMEAVTVWEVPKTMYASIALNVRRGPSTKYEVLTHLAAGQAVEITGQAETGWYQMIVDGTPAYASHRYLSENKVEPAAQPQVAQPQAPASQAPEAAGQPAQAPVQTQAPTAAVAPAGVIMVGDSRCVQMQAAVGGGGCSWICENSKEYTWFSETAIPKFDQYVGKGTKVVINMGVNDPEHYNQYVELVNAKAAEWAQRGARTYFVSVNPVWENPYTDQEDVDTFNANVPGMLSGVTWIDTSSWLNTNGYRLLDGLHYDDPTYVNIFNLIMGSL